MPATGRRARFHGSRETPEFQRHPAALAQALRGAGREVKLMRIEDLNHFECQRAMEDGESSIDQEILMLTLTT